MGLRKNIRAALAAVPLLDIRFRRHVWSRVHFPESEMRWLAELDGKPFDVAVDIGAAMGGYAWLLNRKARRVVAFEPGIEHSEALALGLPGSNIELERSAVGAEPGTLTLFTPGDDDDARHSATLSTTNPVVAERASHRHDVRVVSLDQYCEETFGPDERLDFLKIDVEGFEGEVITGARHRIAKDLPLVLCEIEERHNADYAQIFASLSEMGYRAHYMKSGVFHEVAPEQVPGLQTAEALEHRLSEDYRPGQSRYFNNFLFSAPGSRLQVN